MGHREDILALLAEYSFSRQKPFDTSDIFLGNGLAGDDADELIDEFADRMAVDTSGFLACFHYIGDEPPSHRRIVPVDPNGHVYPFIPVTLDDLVAAALAGRWTMVYPKHKIRESLRSRVMKIVAPLILIIGLLKLLWTRL